MTSTCVRRGDTFCGFGVQVLWFEVYGIDVLGCRFCGFRGVDMMFEVTGFVVWSQRMNGPARRHPGELVGVLGGAAKPQNLSPCSARRGAPWVQVLWFQGWRGAAAAAWLDRRAPGQGPR